MYRDDEQTAGPNIRPAGEGRPVIRPLRPARLTPRSPATDTEVMPARLTTTLAGIAAVVCIAAATGPISAAGAAPDTHAARTPRTAHVTHVSRPSTRARHSNPIAYAAGCATAHGHHHSRSGRTAC
jgi:hypothetical protein